MAEKSRIKEELARKAGSIKNGNKGQESVFSAPGEGGNQDSGVGGTDV